jgi:hypothetical protein
MRAKAIRRLAVSLMVIAAAMVGAADAAFAASNLPKVHASPSSTGGIGVPFQSRDGTSWGNVNFVNGFTLTVTGSVYGTASGPGYYAIGTYFEGNARIRCTNGSTRRNYVDGIVRNYSDNLRCRVANIQIVELIIYPNVGNAYVIYIDNPWL